MGFLSKKKFANYILYGIGEIVLVVIGILIAITLHNKKQERDAQNQLRSYLQVYQQDLVQDSTVIHTVLNDYIGERKQYFRMFLSDTVSAEMYAKNLQGYGLILSHSPFTLQQKGINLLEDYVNNNEVEQDTLISTILANHRGFNTLLNETNRRIAEDIDDNMNYFKTNEPWIADILMGKLDNPAIMEYYLSDNYRARLAIHSTLVYGNLEPFLKGLQDTNREILKEINNRLGKD